MQPNATIAVADMTAMNTLPGHRRPLAYLTDVQRVLLDVRLRLTAAASAAGAWGGRDKLREAIDRVDRLQDEVAALAAAAADWSHQVQAEREREALEQVADRAPERGRP